MAVSSPGLPSRFAAWRVRRRDVAIQRWGQAYILVTPAVVLIAVMMVYPVIQTLLFSVNRVQLPAFKTTFVGFANFTRLIHDRSFLNSLVLTVIFVVGSAVLGQNTLGLLIALLLRGRNRVARSVVTSLVIAAWAVPETVAGFCWFAFLYRTGTLNTLLTHFGVQQNWLYTAPMVAVIVANVWFSSLISTPAMPSDRFSRSARLAASASEALSEMV